MSLISKTDMEKVREVIRIVGSLKQEWKYTLQQIEARSKNRIDQLELEVERNKKLAEEEHERCLDYQNRINCLHDALSCCLKQDDVIAEQKRRIEELEDLYGQASERIKKGQRDLLAMGVLLSTREQKFENDMKRIDEERKIMRTRMEEVEENRMHQAKELIEQVQMGQDRIAELELEVRRGVAERQVDASRNRSERVSLEKRLEELVEQHKEELNRFKKEHEDSLARNRAALEGEMKVSEALREKTVKLEKELKELRDSIAKMKQTPSPTKRRSPDEIDAIDDSSPTSSQVTEAGIMDVPPLKEKFPFLAQICQPPKRATKRRRKNTATAVPNALDF